MALEYCSSAPWGQVGAAGHRPSPPPLPEPPGQRPTIVAILSRLVLDYSVTPERVFRSPRRCPTAPSPSQIPLLRDDKQIRSRDARDGEERREEKLVRQGVAQPQARVELVGDARVVVEQGGRVDIGELDRAHRRERLLHARAPQADIAHRRHDAAEDPAAEQLHRLGPVDDVEAFLDRQAEPLPDLELVEPVAHVPARLDDELLALAALGVAQLRVSRAARSARRRHAAPRPA